MKKPLLFLVCILAISSTFSQNRPRLNIDTLFHHFERGHKTQLEKLFQPRPWVIVSTEAHPYGREDYYLLKWLYYGHNRKNFLPRLQALEKGEMRTFNRVGILASKKLVFLASRGEIDKWRIQDYIPDTIRAVFKRNPEEGYWFEWFEAGRLALLEHDYKYAEDYFRYAASKAPDTLARLPEGFLGVALVQQELYDSALVYLGPLVFPNYKKVLKGWGVYFRKVYSFLPTTARFIATFETKGEEGLDSLITTDRKCECAGLFSRFINASLEQDIEKRIKGLKSAIRLYEDMRKKPFYLEDEGGYFPNVSIPASQAYTMLADALVAQGEDPASPKVYKLRVKAKVEEERERH
ncbi:MAG: hypothetical protein AB8F95_01735 [Bacteroidia bacterium]